MNQLEQLRGMTTVVADSGDIESIAVQRPTDATTNPSLLLQAAQMPAYLSHVDEALNYAARAGSDAAIRESIAMDRLAVNFGSAILALIPGASRPKSTHGFPSTRTRPSNAPSA